MGQQRRRNRVVIGCACLLIGLFATVVVRVMSWLHPTATADAGSSNGYVAMGSSFAAGPGLGVRVAGSPRWCWRSEENYPHLLAARRGLKLTDVSCSGATTRDVLIGGHRLPAQIGALRPDTVLVSVTIGGNDVSYIGNLIGWSCHNRPNTTPKKWRRAGCRMTPDIRVDRALAALPAAMNTIAIEVHRRSPRARLVFVDYVTVLPATGSCPDRLPLTDAERNRGRNIATALARITADTARINHARLIRASELSDGHDVCATQPWVTGYLPDSPQVPSYHLTEQAMRFIADAVARTIGD